ncbi:GATA zinc finger domain-containing protein 1 [Teleopsis dalmanni]|uniref:GATA zinc finger domain-containing protein 1 n=1 Tax=Teleopsis dalmanni TaxID=139649 RepID=UPI0018CD911A|nr:GATA zinc finger domain-containing protein 1 [Teleopsis dalmanni]
MTPKNPPKCIECEKTESMLWRTTENGQICQACFEQKEPKEKPEENNEENSTTEQKVTKDSEIKEMSELKLSEEKKLRKSTRSTRFKAKVNNSSATQNGHNNSSNNKSHNKGRNRRNIFKKTPFKTPAAQATTHVVESVFYKGTYMQVGDIVSLIDIESNVYYAQIRGLLIDNYCEKSAYLTWLIPTQASPHPNEGFDPATYVIGPDEELSRKLSCLEFIMHAPSNYYIDRNNPYPLPDSMEINNKPGGFIWTTLPEYKRTAA